MGLTLIEAQKYARRAEQLAVLKTFAEGELLRRLPFRNLVGGSLSFPAETKLPRVGFRAVNEGYRQSYGVINSDSEFVHLFGGDLDVDRSIVDLQGPEARAAQTEMKVRSMRLTLEAAIINGYDTIDTRAFNGLSKRLAPGDEQTIDNGGSTLNLLALEALSDSVIGYGGERIGDSADTQEKPCYDQLALMRRYPLIAPLLEAMEALGWGPTRPTTKTPTANLRSTGPMPTPSPPPIATPFLR